jgi:hypothetical protein
VRADPVRGELDHQRCGVAAQRVQERAKVRAEGVHVASAEVGVPDVEGGGSARDRAGHVSADRGRLGYFIVLDDDQQRHPPQLGHVQRLVDSSLPPGPVADVGQGEIPGAGALEVQRDPHGQGQALALYARRQVVATVDVLAPAHPAAHRPFATHDLGQQALGIAEARQVVAVATMIAEDEVGLVKQRLEDDRNVLLAQAGVGRAVERTLLEEFEQLQLEVADEQHQLEVCLRRCGEPASVHLVVEGQGFRCHDPNFSLTFR